MKNYKIWTLSDVNFLKQNHNVLSTREIAIKLNRSPNSIYSKKAELGLTSDRMSVEEQKSDSSWGAQHNTGFDNYWSQVLPKEYPSQKVESSENRDHFFAEAEDDVASQFELSGDIIKEEESMGALNDPLPRGRSCMGAVEFGGLKVKTFSDGSVEITGTRKGDLIVNVKLEK